MYASQRRFLCSVLYEKIYIEVFQDQDNNFTQIYLCANSMRLLMIPLIIISLRNIYILYFISLLIKVSIVSLQGNKSFWREIWISLESANRIVFINISCINVHSKLTCFFLSVRRSHRYHVHCYAKGFCARVGARGEQHCDDPVGKHAEQLAFFRS